MIKPEAIPQFTGDLGQLEKDYGSLKTDAGHIRSTGSDVHTQFQGLSAYYQAPEAEKLFASTKPVQDRADTFADDLEKVSTALSDYATEVRPLVTKLAQLKADATTFVNANKGDDDWEYDEDKVDEHNQLRDDVTATVAAFWAAERTCHNKITALFGGTQMVAGDGSDRKDQYGFNADDLKNAKLPWGDPVEEKHHAWEVGHWVKSFVWDGLIVDGIWGTIKGLGTLVGFGGWDAMGQAWKGLAQLATGLAITAIPGAGALFWTLPDDKLPSWLRDSRTAMKETGKALVAWDEWGKNPGRAAGAVTFNVLTTVFTGGAGAGVSGAGKAGAVAKVLSVAGKAGKVIDPMTYIAKGAGAGLSKIGDITKGLKGIENIEIPKLPDDAIVLPEGALKLPDGAVHLPEGAVIPDGAVKLPDGNFKLPDDVPVLPEGATKLPTAPGAPARYFDNEYNLLDENGNVLQKVDDARVEPSPDINPDTGADTPHTGSPDREPALVGAGAHTADATAHVGANAGDHVIRIGDSLGNDLGDIGRTGDNLPGGNIGDNLPGGNAGNHLPGGGVGDHMPTGHAGDNLPGDGSHHVPGGNVGDTLPGGHADDLGHGPSTSHEPPIGGSHGDGPGGPHDHTSPHHDDHAPGNHTDDAMHQGSRDGHDDHSPGSDGHNSEGATPHDHSGDSTHPGERDVREPGGTVAEDVSRRAAEPIRFGDEPLPPPGPGEKLLGQLPESRVRRNSDGLITHVDGRNFEHFLKDLSFQRGAAYKEAKELGIFPRKQVGACVGSVMDLRTGMVFEGINGKFDNIIPADRVHPTIAARYESILDSKPAPDHPLGHAEVKAVNELLWERQKLGLPDGEAALSELHASVEFPFLSHMKTDLPGRPASFCANCNLMLDGVDSSHGRFTGNPPTDDNWIP
ncbi:hypothetical protein OG830_21455 [Streptomyces sp. NBC_00121]|uniref:hypothetical protein n=1 Tax=unclassified Streptomyces TaxID=2593676 RepID=UPI002DDAF34C|nr:hypothetical protein [Streptomyces sp. NBC_01760]WSC70793.1 hypothetical protein OG807_21365 [Streptomyces sp. NBC_01760]